MIEKFKSEDDGVSPVIGVILLVAVTVALVALATVIVFDIGSDVSETADATVQLNQQGESVQATIVRNENVQQFTLSDGDGTVSNVNSNNPAQVGETLEMDFSSDNPTTSRKVSVIATLEDGTEEVLTSTDYEG